MTDYAWKSYGSTISMPNTCNAIKDILWHAVKGTHGAFKGRKYRRGKDRCKICGAPNNSLEGETAMDIPRIDWGNTTP